MTLLKSISGIRGTLGGFPGEAFTPIDIVKFTTAFGHWLPKKKTCIIVIGQDARSSGDMTSYLVRGTLQGLGIDVIDLGLTTTPTLEIAVVLEKALGGIMITASHNPASWNALKLLNSYGEFISDKDGKEVLSIAEKEKSPFVSTSEIGSYKPVNHYLKKHIKLVIDYPLVDRLAIKKAKFNIAVDGINSTGGIAVPALLKALGVSTVKKIHCDPNGQFAHNPEPLPKHLGTLGEVMRRGNYDVGIAVDPDVDRLVFIQEDGVFFGEEYTLVAIADYILSKKKGNVVSNLSSTRALRDLAEEHSCGYFPSSIGEVNVTEKMKQVKAVIGGEGNGGVILPDFHYGRDALIGIALFLTFLAKTKKSVSEIKKKYTSYHISKEKITLKAGTKVDKMLNRIAWKYRKEDITVIDGVKIDFKKNKEWIHLRQSNTEPIIRIYAEAASKKKSLLLTKEVISYIKSNFKF